MEIFVAVLILAVAALGFASYRVSKHRGDMSPNAAHTKQLRKHGRDGPQRLTDVETDVTGSRAAYRRPRVFETTDSAASGGAPGEPPGWGRV